MDDIRIVLAEQRLGGRAHAKALLELFAAAVGDPRHLRRKALDMILFLLQKAFGDEHGHTDILVPRLLEHTVQNVLDILPDRIRIRADDHAALHTGIAHKLRFFHDVGIPLGEIVLHRGDGLHHLLVLCHMI